MKKLTSKRVMTTLFVFCVFIALLVAAASFLNFESTEKKTYKLILMPKTIDESNGFWTSLIAGAKLGAEEFGVELEVLGGKSEEDVEGQIQQIEEVIKKKPDAILVSPCSYSETTEVLQKVVDRDIRLILIDSVIDRDIADSIVATDSYLAGEELGEFTRTLLDEDSQIGIVGHVKGASTVIEREQGMRDGLGSYAGQVQDVVYCDSSYDKAYALTVDLMERYPDIKVIMGTNEYAAVGAARAIKDLGLSGKVQMVGFDNSIEEIQMLEEGIFQGIVIQKPFNMGYLGIEQAVAVLEGRPAKENLDVGCKLITRDNMYEEENQRLLYPFTGQQ
ncbi:substrate-binding domain-containing protein [Luxibacter massiliensis]|uniref:substrate-binding domain-containing protein n=1 Tax=Luxibacter massiliensis TaxID=2219695 RepID=UPI000F06F8B7|nr:substrate-binding domain-containing protein [Luxibacter massiliensis]